MKHKLGDCTITTKARKVGEFYKGVLEVHRPAFELPEIGTIPEYRSTTTCGVERLTREHALADANRLASDCVRINQLP